MATNKLAEINVPRGAMPAYTLIRVFGEAAARGKSAHFCRYSCALYDIG